MQSLLVAVSLCLLVFLPADATAQRGAPPFNGPRGALAFELSDGEPVSFYLEWSRLLDLSNDQKTKLIELRRKLRAQNAPFMQQLDSLRAYAGVDLSERRRMTDRDLEALRRFNEWAAPITDSIRLNNDGARADIRVILDSVQVARGDSIAGVLREMMTQRGRGRREELRRRLHTAGH